MFGIGGIEILIVGVMALLVVGPKELPGLMRIIGRGVGKARAYARHFTAGIDNIVREAELEEMEKQWKRQNEEIMKRFPADLYDEQPPLAGEQDVPREGDATPPRPDGDERA
ncbi:Sec-independent protein translocase subunit TatA/TatB [Sphingomicrobium arenosum]|uniref:Sec-independent protein translocase subunit TatA/TatB n=1 Tax=Sphingomicrobium arenosum TaxID=2233861 RepID=UPI00223EA055|nr:twin-arginine translocase TatA/TatE family subunit [Sphingomicrobium arenosum]